MKTELSPQCKESGRGNIIKYIAYLQIIGILLVVFGHSFHEYPDGNMGKSLLIYRMMYSFRMPLFMFVSGFLMVYTNFRDSHNGNWLGFTISKIKRLLVPYFFLSIVTFVPRSALSFMADDKIELTFRSVVNALLYGGEGMVIPLFWFLQASFLLLISTHLLITFGRRLKLSKITIFIFLIVVSIGLLILPFEVGLFFSVGEAIRLSIYFILGIGYCFFREKIDGSVKWTSVVTLFSFTLLWVVSFFLTEDTEFVAICSVFGILMCVSIAKILESKEITILDSMIGANYMIFLLSWYFNVLSQQVLSFLIELPWWCYTVISFVSAIYFPWLIYRVMLRNSSNRFVQILAFLLGQNLRKSRK